MEVRIIGTSGVEGKGDNQLNQPRGIWIDLTFKEIYVCDCNNHRISVFSSVSLAHIRHIGRGIQGTSLGCLNYAVGLCLDDSKHIYVADTNNHRIAVFHQLTGAQINTIGSQGTSPGKLSSPYGVCVDKSTGSLFVADYENHRIQVFNKDTGAFERIIGSYGIEPGQFNKPIVSCIDEDNGNLFVCDYANNRVQVFNKDTGVYIRQLGNVSSGLGSDALLGPRGICLDRGSKLLFISDRENNRIQMYNKNTFTFIRHLGVGPGLGPGQFNKPMELCVNPDDGTLLVVDGYNHRVQIIPVPELQVESLRIQKEKKEKLDREAKERRRPRASSRAISTSLTKFIVVDTNLTNSHYTIHFDGTGRLYDLLLTQEEMMILNFTLERLKALSPALSKADLVIGNTNEDQIINEQSTLFLSLISNMSQQPNTIKYIVPSVLALHALLERQWKPSNLSTQNYSTFLNLLFNATYGTTSINEKKSVINAIISILTASMEISTSSTSLEPYDHIIETVFQILISEFSKYLVEYIAVYEIEDTTRDINCNLTESSIMLAALSIISNIFIYEWFRIGSKPNALNRKYINSKGATAFSRNAVNVIFGTTFVSSIQKFVTSVITTGPDYTAGDINTFVKLNHEVLPLLEITLKVAQGRRRKTLTESIQIELFQKAKTHLETARNEYASIKKVIDSKYGNPVIATSRGGRNIWRPNEPLKVGDLIDAIDKENIWYESYVVSITSSHVRVHFMGWGSKWDDDIPEKDIHRRIAPLNSKTKNWRGELFEGGLIEIKCNEDMVNQKWMWGRIVLLSIAEGWVEISYSFANETSIIKRADLYGETICPVGMHTKDRSKAASAVVVKPMAKIEDLIHQKSNSIPTDEQELFLDRSDASHDSEVGQGIFNCVLINDNFDDDRLENSDVCSSNLIYSLDDCSIENIVSNISITTFEIIMKEVVQVMTLSVEDPNIIESKVYKLASEILSILTTSPFQQLLVTCFCRVVIVQCGIRSKILVSGFLQKNPKVVSNLADNMLALSVFIEKLSVLEEKYTSLIIKSIGSLLEIPVLKIIIERIKVTVTSCSILPVITNMTNTGDNFAGFKNAIASCFLDSDRFSANAVTLRKFLMHIYRISTLDDMNYIKKIWIDVVYNRINDLCFKCYEKSMDVDAATISLNSKLLLGDLMSLLEKSRNISKLEFLDTNNCDVAAELAFIKAFTNMTKSSNLESVKVSLLQSMVSTMSSIIMNKSNHCIKKNSNDLDSIVDFIKVTITDNCFSEFAEFYQHSLAHRLLQPDAYNNTESELLILRSLPTMNRCFHMIKEIQETKYFMQAFRKYYLRVYDSYDHDYDDEGDTLSSLLLNQNSFNVNLITPSNWPTSSSSLQSSLLKFSTLTLPYEFQDMISEFEKFYHYDGINRNKRCLNWYHSMGTATIKCNISENKFIYITVNTIQAAMIMQFSYNDYLDINTLSEKLNLNIDITADVVSSLSNDSASILEYSDRTTVKLSNRFLNGLLGSNNENNPIVCLPSSNDFNKYSKSDSTWRMNVIESMVLRVLKNVAKSNAGTFINYEGRLLDTFIGPANIHKAVLKLPNNKKYYITSDDIIISCDRLHTLDLIDKIKGSGKNVEMYGYSYVTIVSHSKNDPSINTYGKNISRNSSNTNEALWNFTQLLSSRILSMKYPDFKGDFSLLNDDNDASLFDTKTSLNCFCDIQKQLTYTLIRVISQIYQTSTSLTSSGELDMANVLDKLKHNTNSIISSTNILLKIEKTILNCLPANTMMMIISLFQSLKSKDKNDTNKNDEQSLSFNARWETSSSLSLSFSTLWESTIRLSRKAALEGKYQSLPIIVAKEMFLFAFENKRAFNEEFHESKMTQFSSLSLSKDCSGEDGDIMSFTFKDLVMAILRVTTKLANDDQDDNDYDIDSYDDYDDDDDDDDHITKFINSSTTSSRIRHHHYSLDELDFLNMNRTNTTSSNSSSNTGSNNNSSRNSRANSINYFKDNSVPRPLITKFHRDGPCVLELIEKNSKFSTDGDKCYSLKDSLLFTLQHLNSSICLLTHTTTTTTTTNTNTTTDNSVLDDDSLNELLLDLFDDILISTSINSINNNDDDAIENYKDDDDDDDDRNTITFRNIGTTSTTSIININTSTNPSFIVKKIYDDFDTDPIVGIERFKFDVSTNTTTTSTSSSSSDSDNQNTMKSDNNHSIDIYDKILMIREVIPSLSSSLSLRLLSHYHWDINSLIDDYTTTTTTTSSSIISNVHSYKAKNDHNNEKTLCNCCCDHRQHGDMYGLTCGHYFCRSCWSIAINNNDGNVNHQCLQKYCMISITSDFIDVIVGDGHDVSSIVLNKEISLLSSSFDMYLKYQPCTYLTYKDKWHAFQKNTVINDVCLSCSSPYHYPATCGMMMHWTSSPSSPVPSLYNDNMNMKMFNSPMSQRGSNNNTANSTPTRSSTANPFLHTPTSTNSNTGYIINSPPYRDLFKTYYDFYISADDKYKGHLKELGLNDLNDLNDDTACDSIMRKQNIASVCYTRISLSAWHTISFSSRFLAYMQIYLNYNQSVPTSLTLSLLSFQESVSKLYILINHTNWDKDKDKNKIYATIHAIKKKMFNISTILEQ